MLRRMSSTGGGGERKNKLGWFGRKYMRAGAEEELVGEGEG